jgi:hypothetical protein
VGPHGPCTNTYGTLLYVLLSYERVSETKVLRTQNVELLGSRNVVKILSTFLLRLNSDFHAWRSVAKKDQHAIVKIRNPLIILANKPQIKEGSGRSKVEYIVGLRPEHQQNQ